jgi:hypothetical protein
MIIALIYIYIYNIQPRKGWHDYSIDLQIDIQHTTPQEWHDYSIDLQITIQHKMPKAIINVTPSGLVAYSGGFICYNHDTPAGRLSKSRLKKI